jgi:hypothetical protein
LVPDTLDRVLVHADQFSQEPIRLPRIPAKLSGDQVTALLASNLPSQAVRLDGMVPLAVFVQPADDAPRIVPDPKLAADSEPLVSVQDLALGRHLDGNLHAPLSDVTLEGLELVGREVREDLIRRSMVTLDLAHG